MLDKYTWYINENTHNFDLKKCKPTPDMIPHLREKHINILLGIEDTSQEEVVRKIKSLNNDKFTNSTDI